MNRRDAVLRRVDDAARAALLSAGLLAQWAMWTVAHSRVYPIAALVLMGISIESARRRFVTARSVTARSGPARRRLSPRGLAACRILGCVILVEICVGIVGSLQWGGTVSMAVPIGVLLLTVQAAQAMAIESRRDAKLGAVIVVAILVAAGAFATTAAAGVPIVASVLALFATAALLQRGTVLARMHDVVGGAGAPVFRTFLVPASSAVVIGTLVFLALPNSTSLGTRTDMRYVRTAASQGRAGNDPGARSLDLRVRGALSDGAVFAVSVTAPSYWQGAVFDTFDGTTWTVTGVAAAAPTGPAPDSPTRTDTVRVLSAQALDVVLAPGQATAYNGPGRAVVDADGTSRLTGASAAPPWTYAVTSVNAAASAAVLTSAAGTGSADPTDPKWTAVEAGLPSRVRALAAQLTGPAGTRYDAVTAVEEYLRSHETYDLNSPVPAVGVDAVDDFLFGSHHGFCEQFATAAVVMLRSVGIPTRLVTGYSHGDLTSEAGERVMRGVDAHAWIQVWYPGTGWVASDPTATSVLPVLPVGTVVTTKPAVASTPKVHHPSVVRAVPGGRLGRLVLILVGATVVTVLLRIFARWRPRAGAVAAVDTRRPGDGPTLQAYLRLDAALGSGQAREPDETLREVSRRLGGPISARAEVSAALECLERECYSVRPPTVSEVSAAVDVFDRLLVAVGSQHPSTVWTFPLPMSQGLANSRRTGTPRQP